MSLPYPHDDRPGFLVGNRRSSTQAEGAAPASDWFALERPGTMPPSGDGNGFGERYADDFELYAQHGLTHHRLSIEWARIEPEEGRRDDAARSSTCLEVLTAARDAGVSPWVCLHHFTLPGWFTELGDGGFIDDHARSYYWARHVAFCAETFGDLVFGWKPINEPGRVRGHLPARPEAVRHARRDAARATRRVARAARRRQAGRDDSQPLAGLHRREHRSPPTRCRPSSKRCTGTCGCAPIATACWSSPAAARVRCPTCARRATSSASRTTARPASTPRARSFRIPPSARVGPMGYAPWSEGLALVLHRLHEELPGRPLLICEHGVGTDDDEWRCDVLRESLALVERAIADGIDLRGFFHWTGVDNYEWNHGFDVQFGCFSSRSRTARERGAAQVVRPAVSRAEMSAHSGQTRSGITPAGISSAKALQPRQRPNTHSKVAATMSIPTSTSARVGAPATHATRAVVVNAAPMPGRIVSAVRAGSLRERQSQNGDPRHEQGEWAELGSGDDTGEEAVRERDEQPAPTRGELDDREHQDSAGHESRRHLVDGVGEREQAGRHALQGTG